MQSTRKYPRWRVEGRVFNNVNHARAFAKRYALDLATAGNAAKVTIMQQDDSLLPPFMLDVVQA